MKSLSRIAFSVLLAAAFMAGCGSGGGVTTSAVSGKVTLSGTAAAGAPIQNAPISIKDRNGNAKSGTTGTDGKYNIEVTGMTAPFLLKVPHGNRYLFSVATETGTANIHPFTDLIIRNWYKVKSASVDASGDVETDFAGTGSLAFVPTASEINTIEAVVRNILSTWLDKAGLNASAFNLLNSSFDADNTGFDKVLDNTGVAINDTTGDVTVTTADPVTGIEGTTVSTNLTTDLTTRDTTKPTDPTGLAAIPAGTTSIVLVWNASTDNVGVSGYNIYRGGSKIGSSPYPVYSDTGLTSGSYCYQVEAFDGAGNTSANKSSEVCAQTLSAADTTLPSAPTGLTATAASSSQINLSWTASTSTDVVGYAISRGGTKIAAVNGTNYSDTGLSSGTLYSYTVKALDGALNLSVDSNTASATPAAPTVDVTGTWYVTGVGDAGGGTFTMNLIQSDSSVSGIVTIMGYSGNLSGSVIGSNISLTTPDPQPTCSGSVGSFTGTVSGNTMSGNYTSTAGGTCPVESGTWTATKLVSGVGAKFPIATTPDTTSTDGTNKNPGREFGVSAAFDGTNYLVGIQGDATAQYNVGAQLMDGSGNLVGSRISTGRTGGAPWIAFNGTNYLMVWPDDATNPNDVIYGEVLSTTGAVVKAPFAISTTVGNLDMGSIVCLGGGCGVMWYDRTTQAVYGRDIDSTGNFASNEITAESGTATGNPGGQPFAACDTLGNCLGVYDTGTDIRGSIGNATTVIKNTFVIATKAPVTAGCKDWNPSPVAFDGTNYLVVWNDHSDCAPIPTWDILAQRVDVNGNLVGAPFQVNSSSTKYAAIPFMAFDGTNFLVTWSDGRNDANKDRVCDAGEGTCYDVYGQYISKAGLPVGSEFVINNDAGNQLGVVTGFNNGKYLVLVNTGWIKSTTGEWLFGDVYGVFVTP